MNTFNLGGFKFRSDQIKGMNFSTDFCIKQIERINNIDAIFANAKPKQSLQISAQTLPFSKDGTIALKALYDLAKKQQSLKLINANGKYYGRFVIKTISENRSVFSAQGGFFYQNFELELIKDGNL